MIRRLLERTFHAVAMELQRLRHGDPPHTKKQMEILGEADSTLQDALAPFTEDRA